MSKHENVYNAVIFVVNFILYLTNKSGQDKGLYSHFIRLK